MSVFVKINNEEIPVNDLSSLLKSKSMVDAACGPALEIVISDVVSEDVSSAMEHNFVQLSRFRDGEPCEVKQRLVDLETLGFVRLKDLFCVEQDITKRTLDAHIDQVLTAVVGLAASFASHGLSQLLIDAFKGICQAVGVVAKEKLGNILERIEVAVRHSSFVFAFIIKVQLSDTASATHTASVISTSEQKRRMSILSCGIDIMLPLGNQEIAEESQDQLDHIDLEAPKPAARRIRIKELAKIMQQKMSRVTTST